MFCAYEAGMNITENKQVIIRNIEIIFFILSSYLLVF